jgi:hypothetical protein
MNTGSFTSSEKPILGWPRTFWGPLSSPRQWSDGVLSITNYFLIREKSKHIRTLSFNALTLRTIASQRCAMSQLIPLVQDDIFDKYVILQRSYPLSQSVSTAFAQMWAQVTAPNTCSLVKFLVCRRGELCNPHMGPHRHVCGWSKRILNIMLSRLVSFGCVQVELIWSDESKGLCESFPDRQLDVIQTLFKLYGCSSSWVLLANQRFKIYLSFGMD